VNKGAVKGEGGGTKSISQSEKAHHGANAVKEKRRKGGKKRLSSVKRGRQGKSRKCA